MCPHDVFDWWVDRYGRTLDAFWPVVDTPIGRMGIMMANEGSYPENARALAMNGAELVYRASIPHPAASNDYFEIQTRARVLDNNMYVLAPNVGTYYLTSDSDVPDRDVRRRVDDCRLPGPNRRQARVLRRVVVGERAGEHRGSAPSPDGVRCGPTGSKICAPSSTNSSTRSPSTRRICISNVSRTSTPSTAPRSSTVRWRSCTIATSGRSRHREQQIEGRLFD